MPGVQDAHRRKFVSLKLSMLTFGIDTRELGIGIVPYSPLGWGFFAGKAVVESLPRNGILALFPRFSGANLEKNKILYTRLQNMATKFCCTPAQLALAWVLYQGNDVVPIPGTTKIKNLEDNIGSLNLSLTEEGIREISDDVPIEEVAGSRAFGNSEIITWKYANTPAKE